MEDAVLRNRAALGPGARNIVQDVAGWLRHVRIEGLPRPSDDAIRAALPIVLPALRHLNDVPAVVSAMQARPDWVISTNTAHWNAQLAARTGLRIATPRAFLEQLYPVP